MLAFVLMGHSVELNAPKDSPVAVMENIQENIRYIRFFNPKTADEVVQEIFTRIMQNNRGYGDYTPYIKKLARTLSKRREQEKPTQMFSEDGEVAGVFRTLKETVELKTIEGLDGLYKRLRHLYLHNEHTFHKLTILFEEGVDLLNSRTLKKLRTKDMALYNGLREVIEAYGTMDTFIALEKFMHDLPNIVNVQVVETMRDVTIRPLSRTAKVFEKLPDKPTIKLNRNGVEHGINPTTLLSTVDPDYNAWTVIGATSQTKRLQKIDLTPYLEYLYKETHVEEGLKTKCIIWCGGSYKLTSPSGDYWIDENLDYFINQCRIELVASIMRASLGTVVALSNEAMYFKGKRVENIKLSIAGKVILLPIEMV